MQELKVTKSKESTLAKQIPLVFATKLTELNKDLTHQNSSPKKTLDVLESRLIEEMISGSCDIKRLGWCPAWLVSLTSWGDASLTFIDNPSSYGVTIKNTLS